MDTDLLYSTKDTIKNMNQFVLSFLILSLRKFVISTAVNGGGDGLRNKHLIIEGETWHPYLDYDYYEDGTYGGYRGVMYDLLLYMQKERNFTFSMVSDADWEWGECYATNNCTGMIGMVNRKEVDLAIGKSSHETCRCVQSR